MTFANRETMVQLKLFDDALDAYAARRRSRTKDTVDVFPLGQGGHYLKRRGSDGVEPLYLCEDGRWRRYDTIVNFDGSAAQAAVQELLNGP